jgi:predicted RNA binding protein YcfA (HicA-like mRNA interferase family)
VSAWHSVKARQLLAALQRIGWSIKRTKVGSHTTLARPGYDDYTFAFHESEEIGPKMLAKVAKRTGLKPTDL